MMDSRSNTRVAIVGYGYWGAKHARVLSALPDVDPVVVDFDTERLRQAGTSFPAFETAGSLAEVIETVDAVIVATPPASHATVALNALAWGKHTLVEKPLATSVPAARLLVDVAAKNETGLMVGHTFEYNAAVWKLKELIQSGELGRVLYIDTARLNLGLYRRDVNVVWDLAPHDLSIISFLLDEVPTRVSAWVERNVGRQHGDLAYLRLELERSATRAFVHVSWLDPQKVRRVTVVGDRKMAVYNDLSDNDRIRVYDIGVDPGDAGDLAEDGHAMPVTYRTGDIVSPRVDFHEPLLVQDVHFIDCVRTNGRPHTPGERGLEIVRVLHAADLAHATGHSQPVVRDEIQPHRQRLVEYAHVLARAAANGGVSS